jgi:predicted TIM-barrel fold metal-dependent hydrolase
MTVRAGTPEWLALTQEEAIDPHRPIIDPHHHLWRRIAGFDYLMKDLWRDCESGHRILKTIHVECGAEYDPVLPSELQSTGESRFIAEQARFSREARKKTVVAGLVAHADLRHPGLQEILDAHFEASQGLLRGIRQIAARDESGAALLIPGTGPAGLYSDSAFRKGLKKLGRREYSFDAWHFHHQMRDFIELARAVPDTVLILDHFGTPLGVGPYAGQRVDIFARWREDICMLAQCPNVYAKLGGLAMPDNGFGWNLQQRPPSSDEIVATQEDYYRHVIEQFGPARCMFESNFPVDRFSVNYGVLWNAFKKMTKDFSEHEKSLMFYETAARLYRV